MLTVEPDVQSTSNSTPSGGTLDSSSDTRTDSLRIISASLDASFTSSTETEECPDT